MNTAQCPIHADGIVMFTVALDVDATLEED